MTTHKLEAVFQNGVFLPVRPLAEAIEEGQHVQLVVEVPGALDVIELAGRVFDDLPEEEQREIEAITLERRDFFGQEK